MNAWVEFYAASWGSGLYQHFDDKDISTEYSALMSKVMANGNGADQVPHQRTGARKEEVADRGVSRVLPADPACSTSPARPTTSSPPSPGLRDQGVEFLRVPGAYYHELAARVGAIDEPVEMLEQLGILVDRDDEGYMLQIFTRPVEDRPTLFYEVIQRKGKPQFREGEFQGAVRIHRTGTGPAGQSLRNHAPLYI